MASRTAGPISMCQVSGGIQETCADWLRLNRIRGSTQATAARAAAVQRLPTSRPARLHSRVVRRAGRIISESQFSRPLGATVPP
ncbi:hypothetical protein [Streptomyces sp. WZ.A104]|uniref:hypothetical protein n=1 Tax=Streptomyces sp. WZ.A104 TaxID=2023771 RepID=UPI0027B8EECB|nr:hypothetical protein [Streptomyces sp. WZ.A104]